MDAQLLFLQMWAEEVQPIVDGYVELRKKLGPNLGYKRWQQRAVKVLEQKHLWKDVDTPEQFQEDVISIGYMYVDLMIRFGVFNDDSKS